MNVKLCAICGRPNGYCQHTNTSNESLFEALEKSVDSSSSQLLTDALARDEPLARVFAAAYGLQHYKARDYNAGIERDQYFPLGLASYAHEIHKKALRLVALSASGKNPEFESTEDTCLDLINYAAFAAEWLRRNRG